MNILFWKRSKTEAQEQDTWEIAEKPSVDLDAQHRETMEIIEDILRKLDEIKILIDEMKDEEDR
jgi:hypothetical protein